MDWLKGKNNTGNPPCSIGKTRVSCRFSLKPIRSEYGEKTWAFDGKRVIS
jgi:hypothetical protein